MNSSFKTALAIVLCALPVMAAPASAKCKKMGFLVNDYGKEGPTADAKALLDNHIAEWAASQGIKKFTIGKKEVKCELFLNLIIVDEHTCTASATVCWDEPGAPAAKTAATKPEPAKEAATPKAAPSEAKSEADTDGPAEATKAAPVKTVNPPNENAAKEQAAKAAEPVTPPSTAAEPPAEAATTSVEVPATAPAAAAPAVTEAKAEAASPADAKPAAVETGAIQAPQPAKPVEGPPVPLTETDKASSAPATIPASEAADPSAAASRAAEAAAAAERAAEAAERAAAAAERAAIAASERLQKSTGPVTGAAEAAAKASNADAVVPPVAPKR
jgi:hypothetical protein